MEYLYAYADPITDMYDRGLITVCPTCDKTAMKVKYTPDIYHCMACKNSFYKVEGNNVSEGK